MLSKSQIQQCREAARTALREVAPQTHWRLTVVSRLMWRNVVFRAHSESRLPDFAVKVFMQSSSADRRFEAERLFTTGMLPSNLSVDVPVVDHATRSEQPEVFGVVVRQWIPGESLMTMYRATPDHVVDYALPAILDGLEALWRLPPPPTLLARIPRDMRLRTIAGELAERMGTTRLGLLHSLPQSSRLRGLVAAAERLCDTDVVGLSDVRLVNGDTSAHDWVSFRGKWLGLDWETSTTLDPVVDLAGLYNSLGHQFIERLALAKRLEKVICDRVPAGKRALFAFYFLERVVASAALTQNQLSEPVLAWELRTACALAS